jgi:hypothetical protein
MAPFGEKPHIPWSLESVFLVSEASFLGQKGGTLLMAVDPTGSGSFGKSGHSARFRD